MIAACGTNPEQAPAGTGNLELQVADAFHFIFTEAEGFDEPDTNLASLEDNGRTTLVLKKTSNALDTLRVVAWAGSHPAFFVLGKGIIQTPVATAHTENCANRFWPTPVAPFSIYRAQAQSGSNRLVVDDQ